MLSLFDDPEAGYQAMRPQLTRLFGPDRTLSLEWDFGVLEWFIRFYAEEAKRYRGKTDLVVRTLLKLPYMNMKPDSREFSVLLTAGYSMEEITLANSLAVWADRIPGRLLSKGITAEKIAAACVRKRSMRTSAGCSWFTRNLRSSTRGIRISGQPSRRDLHPQRPAPSSG